jgi:hypothetical protein
LRPGVLWGRQRLHRRIRRGQVSDEPFEFGSERRRVGTADAVAEVLERETALGTGRLQPQHHRLALVIRDAHAAGCAVAGCVVAGGAAGRGVAGCGGGCLARAR